MRFSMRNFIFSVTLLLSPGLAMALPSLGAFSKAEIQAILNHPDIDGWIIREIKLLDEGSPNKVYKLLLTAGGTSRLFCVFATVESKMKDPEGSARSSEEVEARVLSVDKTKDCGNE